MLAKIRPRRKIGMWMLSCALAGASIGALTPETARAANEPPIGIF